MTPQARLIERLTTMFGEPRTDNPDAYLAEYATALSGYEPDVLEAAGSEVIRSATYWPKPAEVIAVARRLAARKHAENLSRNRLEPQSWSSLYRVDADSRARVKAMVDRLKAEVAMAADSDRARPAPIAPMDRPAVEAMQAGSPNHKLHRTGRLTEASRRMTGDR